MKAPQLLNKEALELAAMQGCDVPNCPHDHDGTIWLNQRCHPKGGLEIEYKAGDGFVTIYCIVCRRPAFQIKVADE